MLIDTHAHLWWPSYEGDLDEVLERARAAGVEKIICPGTNAETSKQAIELAKKYPGVIYAGVGVHPEEVLNFGKVRPSPPMSMAEPSTIPPPKTLSSSPIPVFIRSSSLAARVVMG